MIRLFLFLFLLTACNPLQPQSLKLPEPPATYSVASANGSLTITDQWWTDFNNAQLNQLQDQLFSDNLDLAQALHRLEQLQATEKQAGASRWPNLNLDGSVARDRTPTANGDSDSTRTKLSLAAAYELDLWNKLKDRQTAASLRVSANKHDIQALLLSLSAQLSEQFYLAVEQRQQLNLIDRQINRNEALLETISDRYRAGLATTSDLYQARENLVSLRSRRPQFMTGLHLAQNKIALLLGRRPGTIEVATDRLPLLNPVTGIGLPADMLSRRPDVASAFVSLKAADHDLAAALAEQLPTVNLTATLGRSVTRLSTGDIDGTFWSLALGLTQPLVDGGRRAAESDRQSAIRNETFVAYRKVVLQALEEVESALVAENNSAVRYELLARQLQINSNNLQLTEDNYRSGLTDSDQLLNKEISHINLLSQQLSQQRQRLSQRISLARALGGSWMAAKLDQQLETDNPEQDQFND